MLSSVLVLLSLQNSLIVNGTRQADGEKQLIRLLMSTCDGGNGTADSTNSTLAIQRREIRQLSAGELGKLTSAFPLRAVVGNGTVQEMENAEEESYCYETLPYWDYRMDMELTHPEHSSIFKLLSLLARDRSQSTTSNQTTVPVFESSQPFNPEQAKALELARRDASGILQSLLVVLSTEKMPTLSKNECMSSDPHWLYWDHTQSKCRAVAVEPDMVATTMGITPSGTTTQRTTTKAFVGQGPNEQLWPHSGAVGQKPSGVDRRGKVSQQLTINS